MPEIQPATSTGQSMDRARLLRTLERTAHAFLRACDSARNNSQPSAAEIWLLDNYSFVRSEIRELQHAFSRGFCRKLLRRKRDFRIYWIAAEGVAGIPGRLTGSPLARAFAPERLRQELGVTLSLAELWAIPPIVKLILIEELHAAISGSDLESAECAMKIEKALSRLRSVDRILWNPLIEAISVVDAALRRDPAGIYAQMEFSSRDAYRHAIEEIADSSRRPEEEVALEAIALAASAANRGEKERRAHVGYYLDGPGLSELLSTGRFRLSVAATLRRTLLRVPAFTYTASVLALAVVLTAVFYRALSPAPLWLVAFLALPLCQVSISLVNLAVGIFLPPRTLPRLDFSKGIPDEYRTFVVIPALLLSRAGVERLVERLEIHYLANRDSNLLFGLLTDFPDSASAPAQDDHLLEYCAKGIERLNRAHAASGAAPFYLFHRASVWNERESVWMGRERKRGKLEDFNAYLLGVRNDFSLIAGDTAEARNIRFVITLDSDTQLPRDTAWKMVGSMAHPLNRAEVDPRTGLVREGYAILQPRVSISMASAGKSRLARAYSGQTGLDPYSRAISDVYQDLFGRATFTGKGLYDLRVFHQVMDGRFPANSILSHDLIEGEHAGVGLVTDIDVIDDYPTTYDAYSKRKHRWIRGDWQLLPWLFPRVRTGSGSSVPNHLSFLSHWKIADNLRRSLFECSMLALLIAGWLFCRASAEAITVAAVVILLVPAYADAAASLLRLPPVRFWRSYFREKTSQLLRSHVEALLTIVFLPHQALLSADAIVRSLVRRFVTGRRLLEWESMAQAEHHGAQQGLSTTYLLACSMGSLALVALLAASQAPVAMAVAITFLWLMSPLAVHLVNARPFHVHREDANDVEFLRDVSLRTWSFFRDFSTPDHHWLVPDNVQQQPYAVARRTSPTNFGLQLTAGLAAFDLGYLTPPEIAQYGRNLLNTMSAMERRNGHFFNWYDTATLRPLPPLYVSTVDSGNLAAALIAFRQGCEEMVQGPVIGPSLLRGLRDYCLRLRQALPPSVRSLGVMRILSSLVRQLEVEPADLFFWEGVLSEAASTVRRLDQHIDWACEHLEERNPGAVREIRYWKSALDDRVSAALQCLCGLAPWLSEPFEPALRSCAGDPRFDRLMEQLSEIPTIGGLPRAYDAIIAEIDRIPVAELRGSLAGMLTALSAALQSSRSTAGAVITALLKNSAMAAGFTAAMDFHFLFDKKAGLLRIGYDVATGELDESSYDMLASEARTAVFIAIAKGDIPREAWFHLSRKITSFRGWSTLVSWSGTMFEYLMPALFMKPFEPTLLTESMRGAVKIQQLYARQFGVPWGISEAAHSERDGHQHYQYRAFGVPLMSHNAGAAQDLVIAPYATLLALTVDREGATRNLREMASRGWIGRYGFFESVDFRDTRFTAHSRAVIVRSFMAHHHAMSLMSLCNALCDNSIHRRFHAETMVAATELLLQERVPALLAPDKDPELLDVMRAQTLRLRQQLSSRNGPVTVE
jgi:hypothetical protein